MNNGVTNQSKPIYINPFHAQSSSSRIPQDKDSTSTETKSFKTSYLEYEVLLQNIINKNIQEAKTLNSASYRTMIKSSLFPNEFDTIEDHKKSLNKIFFTIRSTLSDETISIQSKSKILESVAADIRENIAKIKIEKFNDQGKLEDILVAFSTMNTNLWKALIDSKSLVAASFIHASAPLFVSLIPLTLRTAEYISIRLYNIKVGDLRNLLSIYNEILVALDETTKLLRIEYSNNNEEIILKNNQSKEDNILSSSRQIIDAMLNNPKLKEEILKEFSSRNNYFSTQYGTMNRPYNIQKYEHSANTSEHTIINIESAIQENSI